MQGKANPLRVKVKGERGIYKRTTRDGAVRYEVAYSDSDGRQRWRTIDRLQEARDLRAELTSKVRRGVVVRPTKVTLDEFMGRWLERQRPRLRPRTHDLYVATLRLHVRPRLGRRQLQEITVEHIADLVVEMQQGVRYVERDGHVTRTTGEPFSAWTIRGVLSVLGRVFGSAVRAGLIQSNPVGRLEREERPKAERREFPALDREAVGRLIAATPERYRLLVAVSVLTGLRQGEALGLTWANVDTKAGIIQVRQQLDRQGNLVEPKTSAAKRDVPIQPSLCRMLVEHRLASDHSDETDFVFATRDGKPMHYRNIVRRGLDKAITATGLPHLRWHDLRHLAASMLIAELGEADPVSRVLGHASASITQAVYAHEFDKVKRADRVRERMEAAFGAILA